MRRLPLFKAIGFLFIAVLLYDFALAIEFDQFFKPVKWQQRPDMRQGINLLSIPFRIDQYPDSPVTVADDWLCLDGSPVTDLHFWGSYLNWQEELPRPFGEPPGVAGFRIEIYSDAPASNSNEYSHPDRLLYRVWVRQFSEYYVGSVALPWGGYEHKYRYDLDLPRIFWQKRDRVYWLNISAVPRNREFPWGWESSMDRWNDFAVRGYYYGPESWWWNIAVNPWIEPPTPVDMSFELTSCTGPIKWLQFPDMANGKNVVSIPDRRIVADDWLCTNGMPILEVHFWGSYLSVDGKEHWEQNNPGPPYGILPSPPELDTFVLSFHEDVPAGEDPDMPLSHPGKLLQIEKIPASNVKVRYWDSVPHMGIGRIWWEHKFYYVVRLENPFEQELRKVYWLDISAVPTAGSNWVWGWETSKDHWNDNAVRGGESWWTMLGDVLIDFEDLSSATTYYVGDHFDSAGTTITLKSFQWSNGNWTSSGFARVDTSGLAGSAGNEIQSNNINLDFDFGGPVRWLSLRFGEYGGNLNIEVNGDFLNFQNMVDIDGMNIGGVNISVVNGNGNDKGSLTLSGVINQFAIGGQEFYIDDVKLIYRTDMAFLLITKDEARYCLGDFNRDSMVDELDLQSFALTFGDTQCAGTGACVGDVDDYDGDVDGVNLYRFSMDYGRTDCPCSN